MKWPSRGEEALIDVHIKVCRSAPCFAHPMMRRMSFSKPLSSIRSASSSTRYSTPPSASVPSPMRSSTRPGVPITTCAPLIARICCALSTPPNTAAQRTASSAESASYVCSASSRVGARTSARGPLPAPLDGRRRASAGMPKASVLPLPVSAMPTTSFPESAGGHAQAWMGVGSLKAENAPRRRSGIGKASKETSGSRGGASEGAEIGLKSKWKAEMESNTSKYKGDDKMHERNLNQS